MNLKVKLGTVLQLGQYNKVRVKMTREGEREASIRTIEPMNSSGRETWCIEQYRCSQDISIGLFITSR